MEIEATEIPDVKLIKPRVFGDHRGYFFEAYQAHRYAELAAEPLTFVQDNVSKSGRGSLRGLHIQHPHGQGKLVQVLVGEVYDVAVDVRLGSPTFGRYVGAILNEDNHHQLYVPPGFAHGFMVTSDTAIFHYKCTEYYHPEAEFSLRWDDPTIGIQWPRIEPTLSTKDEQASSLEEAQAKDWLPQYEKG
jgi:dTDP-4-dehydrorhamnose 3,5-epimerase